MLERDGTWYFRIMVPKHLREKYGKPEINHVCGKDYSKASLKAMEHTLFYKGLFNKGQTPADLKREDITAEEVRKTAAANAVEFHTPKELNAASAVDAVRMSSSSLLAHKQAKHVTDLETMAFNGIMPPMTMTQALKQYKEIRAVDCLNMSPREYQKHWNKFDEAVRFFEDKMGKVDVWKLTRKEAMKYKNMLVEHVGKGDFKSGTANSKIKWLRIILRGVFDIEDANHKNPFDRIRVESIGDEVKRPALTEADILAIRTHLESSKCSEELRAIAAIAENTGATPKEIVLLEPEDIVLDAEIPHIIVRPNSHRKRGAKTKHRHRELPLIGRALEYMKKFPNGFAKYRRSNGSESMGAALNKHIKKVAPGKTFYCYRHRIGELLMNSGYDENMLYTQPSETMKNSLMGHEGGIQKYYGGGYYLKNLYKALKKALPDYA